MSVDHVHMWMEQPFCTQVWYQTHLNVVPAARGGTAQPTRTTETCRVERGAERTWPALNQDGMYRSPSMNALAFSDVSLFGYMNQSDTPLVSTRGHVMDHIGLGVTDLDAWIRKLRDGGVHFLEGPYAIGEHRAVMIEGPNREAIELIEVI